MYLSGIEVCSVENGLGMRVTVFVSGCRHNCPACQNPQTHSFNYGKQYTNTLYETIQHYLNMPYISGLSVSGGDALWQKPEDIEELIKLCDYTHSINKNVWIWTGFTFEEIMQYNKSNAELSDEESARQKLLFHCDVLVDGRYVDEQRNLTLKWRGSSNQRVLNIPESLKQKQAVLLEGEN